MGGYMNNVNKHKIMGTIAIILLLIPITATSVCAVQITSISIGTKTITSTDTHYVTIKVTDADDLNIVSLNLTWNPSVVRLTDIDEPSGPFDLIQNFTDNSIGFARIASYKYGENSLSGDIDIVRVGFKKSAGAGNGDSTILDISNVKIGDQDQLYDGSTFAIDGQITIDISESGGGGSDSGGGGMPPPVNTNPVAQIKVSSTNEYINTKISFDASDSYDPDGDALLYTWDFKDGTTSDQKITDHMYTSPGTYIVSLTVDDKRGGTNTSTIQINIGQPGNDPPEQPIITGPSEGDSGSSITFTIVSTDADNDSIRYTIDWDDETTITTEEQPSGKEYTLTHTWDTYGVYTISASAMDSINTTSKTQTKTILIDVLVINDEIQGWLIDTDNDGIYDIFKNTDTDNESSLQMQNASNYHIDVDDDGIWDYTYNVEEQTLQAYASVDDTSDNSSFLLAFGLIIIIVIITIFIIVMQKSKKQSTQRKQGKRSKKKK